MNSPVNVPVKQSGFAPMARSGFGLMGSLQREIDRLFDDFTPAFFTPAFARSDPFSEMKAKMDFASTKDGYELAVDLPGLEEKDVDISVDNGVLTVSGEKKFESENKDKTFHFLERGYGSFSRSIALPEGTKGDQIKATLAKGVLRVMIPAPAKTAPKRIAVNAA